MQTLSGTGPYLAEDGSRLDNEAEKGNRHAAVKVFYPDVLAQGTEHLRLFGL